MEDEEVEQPMQTINGCEKSNEEPNDIGNYSQDNINMLGKGEKYMLLEIVPETQIIGEASLAQNIHIMQKTT